MIRYYKKFKFLKVYENWFIYQYKLSDVLGLNVYWHVKKQDRHKIPAIKNIFHTIELDLEQDIETITANFSKQIRQQANDRAPFAAPGLVQRAWDRGGGVRGS